MGGKNGRVNSEGEGNCVGMGRDVGDVEAEEKRRKDRALWYSSGNRIWLRLASIEGYEE